MFRFSCPTNKSILLPLAIALVLAACGKGNDLDSIEEIYEIEIPGTAQKGPFLLGSKVNIDKLTPNGFATDGYSTETYDDLGNFNLYTERLGVHRISISGLHFNEILNNISSSQLTLTALYNVKKENNHHAYVNLLTHLSSNRALSLMSNEGYSAENAIEQAERDVLGALQEVVPATELSGFTRLSLYDTDSSNAKGNAYVLALSAILYQYALIEQEAYPTYNIDAVFSQRLNLLADDIADDGTINGNVEIIPTLRRAMRTLRPDQVEKNLQDYSQFATGSRLPVANMNLFIDTDGDGIVNSEDDDDDNDTILDVDDPDPYDPINLGIVSFFQTGKDSYSIQMDENGYDTIQGDSEDTIIGFTSFTGLNNYRAIDGGGGNNFILGSSADNILDFSLVELLNITHIDGGNGNDKITGSLGNDVIIGGLGSNTLLGLGGDDTFFHTGVTGSLNIFNGGDGYDQVIGSKGDDIFYLRLFGNENSVEVIDGAEGFNAIQTYAYGKFDFSNTELVNIAEIRAGTEGVTIYGTQKADVIIPGSRIDQLYGNGGDDIFQLPNGKSSTNLFSGGDGFDTILGTDQDDVIGLIQFFDDRRVEKIDGGAGHNIITAYTHGVNFDFSQTSLVNIHKIVGSIGANKITGSADNDVIQGGPNYNTLIGGPGDDTFLYTGVDTQQSDVVSGGEGYDIIRGSEGDDHIGLQTYHDEYTVEEIDGGSGYNTILAYAYGREFDFSQTKLSNIHKIVGGNGEMKITGSAGNDVIQGGGSHNTLIGGPGDDVFYYEGVDTPQFDAVSGGEGYDTILGSEGDDYIGLRIYNSEYNVEKIDGGKGTNIINVFLYARNVDFSTTDVVNIHLIKLGKFSNTFVGSANNDKVAGNESNDVLNGGPGIDTAVFNGNRADYAIIHNAGVYTVQDLNPGDGDEGTDTLTNFEFIQFADETMAISSGP
ncbi:MAG: hypothetical protein OEZ47_14940 [Gammaproteobacteria bacterium]|nr:hypothetical protein [Gammaproteobacteria bacterium]